MPAASLLACRWGNRAFSLNSESVPGNPAAMPQERSALSASSLSDRHPSQSDPAMATEEAKQMLDVRLPHIHAPQDENFSWRGFLTHIAVVVIGLLLALGLEQGVEYIHYEIQRERLEADMQATFMSNLQRAQKNIQTLNGFRAYLIELRNAVSSRIAGGSVQPPSTSDPRNSTYVPPPTLGTYEAAKINGSVGLLSLNRIRLYDRIAFQHSLMQRNFEHFYDAIRALGSFANRFASAGDARRSGISQPNISELSTAELIEYRALIGTAIQYSLGYAGQLNNLTLSYNLTLRGAKDAETLLDAIDTVQRAR